LPGGDKRVIFELGKQLILLVMDCFKKQRGGEKMPEERKKQKKKK